MLILGWSFAQTENYNEALTYWRKLSTKTALLEPAVWEAWLATPYAYQQLGDLKQAVLGYEVAVSSQLDAQEKLKFLLKENAWRELLITNTSTTGALLPNSLSRQLIADPHFYNLLKNWRQLDSLHEKLEKSLSILPVLQIVLKEKKDKFIKRSALVNQELSLNKKSAYLEQYQSLQQQFKHQKNKDVAEMILPAEDLAHWKKLQAVNAIIQHHPDAIEQSKLEKFRHLNGVAKWKFYRQRDANLWAVENSLQKLNVSLGKLSNQLQRLGNLSSEPQQSIRGDLNRINALLARWTSLSEQILVLQKQLEHSMSDDFSRFISHRQKALAALAEQANLALARLRFKAIQVPDNE